jgi:hypothetical protein
VFEIKHRGHKFHQLSKSLKRIQVDVADFIKRVVLFSRIVSSRGASKKTQSATLADS